MLSVSTQITRGDDLAIFERMLKSVTFADQLIIFNMERDDEAARKIFKRYKAQVINVKTPKVVEGIRARQVKEAKGEWVLVMDFDEVVTPALQKEILAVEQGNATSHSAFAIKRRNYSLGYQLRHGGWGDDYVPRLFKRTEFIGWPPEIHSLPKVKNSIGRLSAFMEHHKDASLAQMVEKTNRYSDIEARQFFEGKLPRVTPLTLLRKSIMEFIRRYFLKFGFLDGIIGLFQSLYQGYSVFITYAKLYELQRKGAR
jgi:hypothetical protein